MKKYYSNKVVSFECSKDDSNENGRKLRNALELERGG